MSRSAHSKSQPQAEEPVKVLTLITRMNLGGPASQVLGISEGLQARGYRTILAAGTCDEREGDVAAQLPPGAKITTVGAMSRAISPFRDLAAVWQAYRLMRRERPAIVHTHTAKAGLVGRIAASAARVPIVVHTFHGNSMSEYFSPAASTLMRGIERVLARLTDRICVVSPQQLEEISGRFKVASRAKMRVVPLGLDLRGELRQPLPELRDGVLTVGWLGRLVEIKGVPLLVAIIEEAVRRGLPIRFLVGGDGPKRALLCDAAARFGPGRLRWSGWERDVNAFLAGCHVLIQTSRNEGTPVALIQGMAAGRPFVSTAAGGVVDLVHGAAPRSEAGCEWYSNAVLAEPSPAAFVDAFERFLSDPTLLRQMGSAARAFAAEQFHSDRLVADMDRLYRELRASR
jgi:glycosyltransferase involved in cell wall biosynthesis